jgi:hypothetical protein
MPQWDSSDNLFNLQLFYDTIVEMFKRNPKDSWVVDTLEWWNEYVLCSYAFENSTFCRQVPGLQPKRLQYKKQGVSRVRHG